MKRLTVLLVLGFVGTAGPVLAEKMSQEQQNALQAKLIGVLNSRGAQIDRCTERHLTEFPDAKGKVDVAMKVGMDGKVKRATVSTRMPGARNLRPCIEQVAKTYVFAPTKTETVDLNITISVETGAKFRLYGPGETPKAGKSSPPQQGYIRFTGRSWAPGWNSKDK